MKYDEIDAEDITEEIKITGIILIAFLVIEGLILFFLTYLYV